MRQSGCPAPRAPRDAHVALEARHSIDTRSNWWRNLLPSFLQGCTRQQPGQYPYWTQPWTRPHHAGSSCSALFQRRTRSIHTRFSGFGDRYLVHDPFVSSTFQMEETYLDTTFTEDEVADAVRKEICRPGWPCCWASALWRKVCHHLAHRDSKLYMKKSFHHWTPD